MSLISLLRLIKNSLKQKEGMSPQAIIPFMKFKSLKLVGVVVRIATFNNHSNSPNVLGLGEAECLLVCFLSYFQYLHLRNCKVDIKPTSRPG